MDVGVYLTAGFVRARDTAGVLRELTPVILTPVFDARSLILMTWQSRAACLDENPELFFPFGNADPAFHQIDKAKVICRRCEVADTCLRWAMESRQDDGVWGGLSADERRALERRIARARLLSRAAPDLRGVGHATMAMEKPVQWMTLQALRDELDRTSPAWEAMEPDYVLGDGQFPALNQDAHRHQLVAGDLLRRPCPDDAP